MDASSANGENPQSSVVPKAETGKRLAASNTRSRTCSGVSRRVDRIDDADEHDLIGLTMLPHDIEHARGIRSLASWIETSRPETEKRRQQARVGDSGAVGGIPVSARTGVHADATPLVGENRSRTRLFKSTKVSSSPPEGSIFRDSRPSVKSIWTLSAPCSRH